MIKLEVEQLNLLRWILSEQKDRVETTIRYYRQMEKQGGNIGSDASDFRKSAESEEEKLKEINELIRIFEEKPLEIMIKNENRATELEWLKWFYSWADFGPAEDDARRAIKARFMQQTGKKLPEGYDEEE